MTVDLLKVIVLWLIIETAKLTTGRNRWLGKPFL
jgi:hypothetical protein